MDARHVLRRRSTEGIIGFNQLPLSLHLINFFDLLDLDLETFLAHGQLANQKLITTLSKYGLF